jgi:hypothetical protein
MDSYSASVRTLAGGGSGAGDGIGTNVFFSSLVGGVVDSMSNFYALDAGKNVIRKIDFRGQECHGYIYLTVKLPVCVSGNVTTIAGSFGVAGYSDGHGAQASFTSLSAIALDSSSSTLFVADGSYLRTVTTSGIC